MPSQSSAGGPFVLRRFIHIELTCDHCGRVFFRKRSSVGAGRSYCTPTCKALGQVMRVALTCRTCGAASERSPSQIPKGGDVFCGMDCRIVWLQAHPPRQSSSAEALLARHTAKTETCWKWTGYIAPNGYGRTTVGGRTGSLWSTHRLAWMLAAGPIPEEMGIFHTCDVLYPVGDISYRRCVRNDDEGTYEVNGVLHPRRGHLWLGTTADNLEDMYAKGRGPTGERHGSRTHPERVPRGDTSGPRKHPERMRRGTQQPQAKLNDALAREARALYAQGIPQGEIARKLGVGRSTIGRVVRGTDWRHVE